MAPQTEILQGTLDLLILKTLSLEPLHGHGISRRLSQVTAGAFQVNPGSFFPALYRMEQEGWIRGDWGKTENNRRARYYKLTRDGRKRLDAETRNWERVSTAIRQVLQEV
jgi:PadR family transcriptional regulator PadR